MKHKQNIAQAGLLVALLGSVVLAMYLQTLICCLYSADRHIFIDAFLATIGLPSS